MTDFHYKCLPKKTYQDEDYIIEAVQPEHIEIIRQWRNKQVNVLRQSKPISKEEQKYYYETNVWPELTSDQPQKILLSFKYKGELIGYGGLVNISWVNLRAEISFLCDTKIASDHKIYRVHFLGFLNMIKTLAFNTLGLNRFFTETFTYRSEQIKILKYFGMGIEGVLKSSYLKNGKFFNTAIQSIVNI